MHWFTTKCSNCTSNSYVFYFNYVLFVWHVVCLICLLDVFALFVAFIICVWFVCVLIVYVASGVWLLFYFFCFNFFLFYFLIIGMVFYGSIKNIFVCLLVRGGVSTAVCFWVLLFFCILIWFWVWFNIELCYVLEGNKKGDRK